MHHHLRSVENIHLDKSFVTIGSFDGVHRGHQLLIEKFVKEATQEKCPSVVVTFYPHTNYVLRNKREPFYLTTPQQRVNLLLNIGVDYVITLRFTKSFAALSPKQFMEYISRHLNLRRLWVGQDFALGKDRKGDVNELNKLGKHIGYSVQIIPQINHDNLKISSSNIRDFINQGRVRQAAQLLGRFYSLTGLVIYGDRRGRTLGIPTANLQVWEKQIMPASGVYSAWVYLRHSKNKNTIQNRYAAVTNVGVHPTFDHIALSPQIETHILDFFENIYNQYIEVEFVERIRSEQTFPSKETLINQIHSDIQYTRQTLLQQQKD